MNTCTECDRPHYAKGLCRRHYAFTLYVDETCDYCGAAFRTEPGRRKRYEHIYCRMKCRDQWKSTRRPRRINQVAAQTPTHQLARMLNLQARTAPTQGASRWRSGQCAACGAWYISNRPSKTCGAPCAAAHRRATRQAVRARRRARQASAFVETVYRAQIYQRDNYSCRLCEEPLEMDEIAPSPYAPTIDHIIPLARGGTHEPANVQAAHFICNSTKGATHAA